MASYPNLRHQRPSASAEGFRMSGIRLVVAAWNLAAYHIATALSELASPGRVAMRSMHVLPSGAPKASQLSVPLIRAAGGPIA